MMLPLALKKTHDFLLQNGLFFDIITVVGIIPYFFHEAIH